MKDIHTSYATFSNHREHREGRGVFAELRACLWG